MTELDATLPVRVSNRPRWRRCWVDGGVLEANPSPLGVYWSMLVEGDAVVRRSSAYYCTNNEAEWLALREALLHGNAHPDVPLLVYSDSRLVVNQFNERWAAREPRMVRFQAECRALAAKMRFVVVQWRPREVIFSKLGH